MYQRQGTAAGDRLFYIINEKLALNGNYSKFTINDKFQSELPHLVDSTLNLN